MRRRLLLGLLMAPSIASAQDRPVRPPRRLDPLPLPLPPPPAPPVQTNVLGDLAPMPNRNIEPPRDPFGTNDGPRIEPAIIDRPDHRRGFTFGREHLNDREGRLFNDIAPGARLRIPLE